eukprot:scaffold3649_cov108-Isochrysis_galbana.AAC.5
MPLRTPQSPQQPQALRTMLAITGRLPAPAQPPLPPTPPAPTDHHTRSSQPPQPPPPPGPRPLTTPRLHRPEEACNPPSFPRPPIANTHPPSPHAAWTVACPGWTFRLRDSLLSPLRACWQQHATQWFCGTRIASEDLTLYIGGGARRRRAKRRHGGIISEDPSCA